MPTIDIETVSTLLGIILSLGTIAVAFYQVFKKINKIDKVDKIDEISKQISEIANRLSKVDAIEEDLKASQIKAEERKALLYELKENVHDISLKLEAVTDETKFNTTMNKVDTEVLEALADHAIKTQNANGKVHRSLEMLEQLKYNNPKFS